MAHLIISERAADDAVILDLSGDLIFGEGTASLRSALRYLIRDGKTKIFLNLADVGYLDSSGIGELISALTAMNRIEDGQLKILNPTEKILHLFTISKLLTVFDIDYEDDSAV